MKRALRKKACVARSAIPNIPLTIYLEEEEEPEEKPKPKATSKGAPKSATGAKAPAKKPASKAGSEAGKKPAGSKIAPKAPIGGYVVPFH